MSVQETQAETRNVNIEHILRTLNNHSVDYVVLGGSALPSPATCDVNILIDDTWANRIELNFALHDLFCDCSEDATKPKPVPDSPDWMENAVVHFLKSPHGSIAIFCALDGLAEGFAEAKSHAEIQAMQDGEPYYKLDAI